MRSTPAVLARLFGVALVVLAALSVARPVGAHTDFDYSVPTDGASVGTPLTEVTVAFTLPVTLVGSGFEVLDPQGNLLQPFAVTDDDTIFRLQFDPPLAGGEVGVRYTVAAEDGHPLSGSFSFTVSVPLPTSTTAAPATSTTSTSTTTTTTTTTITIGSAAPSTSVAASAVVTSTTSAATASTVGDTDDGSGESNSGLLIGLAAGVAALAAVYLAYRARTARPA